jgi:hypothetical protein
MMVPLIMRKLAVALLLCSVTSVGYGQFSRVGTSAAQFLKFPADPRTASLGGAACGTDNAVSSLYWNPAGVASIRGLAATFSRANIFADISYNFAGITLPIGDHGTLGLSAFYLDSGEMEQTTIDQPDGTGSVFTARSYSFGLSYARYVTEWLMAGLTVKYVREDIWHESANALAFDIGSVLETGLAGLRLGIAITNFGTEMQMSGEDIKFDYSSDQITLERGAELTTSDWPLPLTFRLGVVLDLIGGTNDIISSDIFRLTTLADYNEPNDTDARGNFGVEVAWQNVLFGRAGYYYNYDAAQYSLGLGLRIGVSDFVVKFDYAFVDYQVLSSVHQYGVSIYF